MIEITQHDASKIKWSTDNCYVLEIDDIKYITLDGKELEYALRNFPQFFPRVDKYDFMMVVGENARTIFLNILTHTLIQKEKK